jgi:hypothetical protein
MNFLIRILFILLLIPVNHCASIKGTVAYMKGKGLIKRGLKNVPAQIGEDLYAGDVIQIDDKSVITIDLFKTGMLKIAEQTTFKIPETESKQIRTSKLNLFFGSLWVKASKLLKGESFEIKTPTATAGVRGTEFEVLYSQKTKIMKTFVSEGEVVTKDRRGNYLSLQRGMIGVSNRKGSRSRIDRMEVAKRRLRYSSIPNDRTKSARDKAKKNQIRNQQEIQKLRKWEPSNKSENGNNNPLRQINQFLKPNQNRNFQPNQLIPNGEQPPNSPSPHYGQQPPLPTGEGAAAYFYNRSMQTPGTETPPSNQSARFSNQPPNNLPEYMQPEFQQPKTQLGIQNLNQRLSIHNQQGDMQKINNPMQMELIRRQRDQGKITDPFQQQRLNNQPTLDYMYRQERQTLLPNQQMRIDNQRTDSVQFKINNQRDIQKGMFSSRTNNFQLRRPEIDSRALLYNRFQNSRVEDLLGKTRTGIPTPGSINPPPTPTTGFNTRTGNTGDVGIITRPPSIIIPITRTNTGTRTDSNSDVNSIIGPTTR